MHNNITLLCGKLTETRWCILQRVLGISLDSASRVASGLTTRTHIQNLLSYNPFNVANTAIVGVDGKS